MLKQSLDRFLREPMKPALIMLARPDPQKNILKAIEIFAQPELRDVANLILFLGQRGDLNELDTPRSNPSQVGSKIDRQTRYLQLSRLSKMTPLKWPVRYFTSRMTLRSFFRPQIQ